MKRPSFSAAWNQFGKIFVDADEAARLALVAKVVGGKVKQNIEAGIFTNSCALRMSYVLNTTGTHIPYIAGGTSSGGDGNWYIPRVKDLIKFLEVAWGKPDSTFANPTAPGIKDTGLLIFEVNGWRDAAGHATLRNGGVCSDNCYFGKAHKANLWILK